MAYTTPRTWVAGEVVTAALLNTHLRDNISFVANPPACRAYHNVNVSMANSAETVVSLNSERWDTDAMHSTVTNNNRIMVNTSGLYLVTFNFKFAASATGERMGRIRWTSGVSTIVIGEEWDNSPSGGQPMATAIATVYKAAVADYFDTSVFQTSGGALNLLSDNNNSPELTATWIGLG